ncbi:hypothetical protein TVAG_461180, partial [Trichomonas vaginalis G3]
LLHEDEFCLHLVLSISVCVGVPHTYPRCLHSHLVHGVYPRDPVRADDFPIHHARRGSLWECDMCFCRLLWLAVRACARIVHRQPGKVTATPWLNLLEHSACDESAVLDVHGDEPLEIVVCHDRSLLSRHGLIAVPRDVVQLLVTAILYRDRVLTPRRWWPQAEEDHRELDHHDNTPVDDDCVVLVVHDAECGPQLPPFYHALCQRVQRVYKNFRKKVTPKK